TLSGAPEIRAMGIIDELEPGKRGGYGGAGGYPGREGQKGTALCLRPPGGQKRGTHAPGGGGVGGDSGPGPGGGGRAEEKAPR
ncbi:chorismate-binding protein, partial [Pseudomonas aeruginosa]|uniref:chorismate-binding protein n=1 Tax=Pseudomonas aeruginosa TaxID=287 RepID=UPI0024AEB0F0